MIKKLFMAAIVILLCGCANTDKVITKDHFVYQNIPDELLTKCPTTEPIPVKEYMTLTLAKREEYLSVYSGKLLSVIAACNEQIKGIVDKIKTRKEP